MKVRWILITFMAVCILVNGQIWATACPQASSITVSGGFGSAVAAIGDVNDDGKIDFVVGAPGSGFVQVRSGANGSVIHADTVGSSSLGYSVAGIANFNQYGRADYAAGDPTANGSRGFVILYSGDDGSTITTLNGINPSVRFGQAVSGGGDFNGDNIPDVVISSPDYTFSTITNGGRIDIYYGPDATTSDLWVGSASNQHFGDDVSFIGDIDNDGYDDIAVSSSNSDSIVIIAGDSTGGSVFARIPGTNIEKRSIAKVGDLNSDGRDEFVVGYSSHGNAVVYSFDGSSLDTLYTLAVSGGVQVGRTVAAGLIDNNATPDILVSEQTNISPSRPYAVHVFSGSTGSLLYSHTGSNDFGAAIAAADVDDDNSDNLVIGEPGISAVKIYTCTNSDADTVFDYVDNCDAVANNSQTNSDADSLGDACDNCDATANNDQANSDADSLGNACDNCDNASNNSQANSDADSLGNACDNCTSVTNNNQADADMDAVGDSCDLCTDTDGDGYGDPGFPANTCSTDSCKNIDYTSASCVDSVTGNWIYYTPGNANNSHPSGTTVADVTYLTNYLFNSGPAPLPDVRSGDCNCSGNTTVNDLTVLTNYLFNGGPAPCNILHCYQSLPIDGCP